MRHDNYWRWLGAKGGNAPPTMMTLTLSMRGGGEEIGGGAPPVNLFIWPPWSESMNEPAIKRPGKLEAHMAVFLPPLS